MTKCLRTTGANFKIPRGECPLHLLCDAQIGCRKIRNNRQRHGPIILGSENGMCMARALLYSGPLGYGAVIRWRGGGESLQTSFGSSHEAGMGERPRGAVSPFSLSQEI